MAKNQLFVPNTIKVGYDSRRDTYTGKLAYIIYIDEKGKVRKEASWNSWRDHKLGDDTFENTPTEGFVLNKKVGGYSTGWNHRQSRIRVHDPRGFELEISIENLLYILENTTSTVGKGLEGEFVYGWDGKDLLLIPCGSPDYISIKQYNELLRSDLKLTAKTIKVGATYRNDKEADLIYIGRYDKYENRSYFNEVELNSRKYEIESNKKGKKYWFYSPKSNSFTDYSSLNPFKLIVNDEPSEETSSLIEKLFTKLDLQYFEEKNKVFHSLGDESNKERLLKMIYEKLEAGNYSNDYHVALFDKNGDLQFKLLFDKGYSYHCNNNEENIYYKLKMYSLKVEINKSYYSSSNKRYMNSNKLYEKLIHGKVLENKVNNIYDTFKTYTISYEEFKSKVNEFFEENSSIKDLSFVEYQSSTNEEIFRLPLNYSYNIIN